jgi:hypothetical protein
MRFSVVGGSSGLQLRDHCDFAAYKSNSGTSTAGPD